MGEIPQWSQPDRLAKALAHAGKSRAEMAAFLRMSGASVSNYLAGRSPVPRAVVIAWSMFTGVDLKWLSQTPEWDRKVTDQTVVEEFVGVLSSSPGGVEALDIYIGKLREAALLQFALAAEGLG